MAIVKKVPESYENLQEAVYEETISIEDKSIFTISQIDSKIAKLEERIADLKKTKAYENLQEAVTALALD